MDQTKLLKGYTGYELTELGRAQLLAHIEPAYPDVIAHHVTHEFGVYDSLPPEAASVRVTAVAFDDRVQAVVVKVNGTTARPDNKIYHITVSIDRGAGATPNDSNRMLADLANWRAIDPFNVDVVPKFFIF